VRLEADFDAAVAIIQQGGAWHSRRGLDIIGSWKSEVLTTEALVKKYGSREEFYVLLIDGKPAFAAVLSENDSFGFWANVASGKALYISRLAVADEFRGRVSFSKLIAAVADFARARGCPALRITYGVWLASQGKLYARLGFRRVGVAKLASGHDVALCEIII